MMTRGHLRTSSSSVFWCSSNAGHGWDYPYAGWYLRLLGYAERGFLPYLFDEYTSLSWEQLHLRDYRPDDWRHSKEEPPVLPLPAPGMLPKDYAG